MINQSKTPAGVPSSPFSNLFQPEVLLPILVILGYVAFVTSGFGAGLGMAQPFPIYLYASILLILLELYLANFRSLARSLYGIGAAIFGLFFAAGASFFPTSGGNFTRAPLTYVIVNIAAIIVFGADTIFRHFGASDPRQPEYPHTSLRLYHSLATDFAGLAVLFALSSFLLDFLNTRSALRFLGVQPQTHPINIDLNALFGFALPSTVQSLEGLDLALAFVIAGVWLLIIVIIGGLTTVGNQNLSPASRAAEQNPLYVTFLQGLETIFLRGFIEATYSLRSVLQIFLWLIPAFSIANFAQVATDYFNAAARAQVNIVELFNPVSITSLANVSRGFEVLALSVVALIAVVITVALAEFDTNVISTTLSQVTKFAQTISITLVFFTLSLAVTNAAVKLFNFDQSTPFQVGAATIFALCLFMGNALISTVANRPRTAIAA